jgi:hypothetical protein
MAPTQKQVTVVEKCMRATFKEGRVESGYNFDREVTLFRARDIKAPAWAKELEIADEAFEDYSTEKIVGALNTQHAADRLQTEPERRLRLSRDLRLVISGYDPRHGESR